MAAEHSHAHAHKDDGAVHAHIASAPFYWGIFGALVVLTVVTVKVSYYDFGSANTIIAILIATMKASLVAAFFMHLRHDKLFNTLAFLSAFLFLAIFLLLTYDDLGTRAQIDESYGGQVWGSGGEEATGAMPLKDKKVQEGHGDHGPAAAPHGSMQPNQPGQTPPALSPGGIPSPPPQHH